MAQYKGNTIDNYGGSLVIHFTAIATPDHAKNGLNAVPFAYSEAQAKAKEFGGKKFHNNAYGGGIAFNTTKDVEACIDKYGE